jgi:adenine-specific DNA-methyltransferase
MEKLKMESVNLTQKNIEWIRALFPNVITEMKDEEKSTPEKIVYKKGINFELLKQELLNDVVDGEECYNFTWVGKKAAIVEGNTPIRKTLRPSIVESKDFENTGNLYIEGDNLDALKLLQESYLNSIKMIYIDPPYNTGNDFIYKDNFTISKDEYDEQIGLLDEDEKRLFQNNESNGRFHSDWCSMMYPRLRLAHNLLADDGVIFISIDDNELRNLRNICDEVFGESNFISQMAVQLNPRGRNLDKYIAKTHESLVVYSKNYENRNTMFGVPKEGKMVDEYNKQDERGEYRSIGLRNRNQSFNPATRPNLYYPLYVNPNNLTISLERNDSYTDEVWPDAPDGVKTCWTWSKQKVESENHLLIAERTGQEWRIYRKDYMLDESGVMAITLIKSLWIEKK